MVKKLLIWMDNMVAWMATEGELNMVVTIFSCYHLQFFRGSHLYHMLSNRVRSFSTKCCKSYTCL